MNSHIEQIHEVVIDQIKLIRHMPQAPAERRSDDNFTQRFVGNQLAALIVVRQLVDTLEKPWRKVCDGRNYLREVCQFKSVLDLVQLVPFVVDKLEDTLVN